MTVRVTWDVARRPLEDVALRAAVEAGLEHGGRQGLAVDVIFVDDRTLTDLHARFLGDPSPTDVITFDLGEEGPGPAAELYVSVDCAERECARRGDGLGREIALYLVHGALHLCGYDDHEDEARARMRAAEREVLARLGYDGDERPHDGA